jgi:hypothetical protein
MAAGLGFKTFTTGEVLTAADTNGYLMQGVLVFADAAARDAAITSPQEGQFAYLKDTDVTTYYTSSAWANLDTTGMTNPMTTTADIIYSSSGSTPARLGIGTVGQVLQVNSGATAPEWAAPAAGGKVLQVVNAEITSAQTIASTSQTDTGITATITPTLATSKILILITANPRFGRNDGAQGIPNKLLRGVTEIQSITESCFIGLTGVTTISNYFAPYSTSFLDSPATTSATTYKLTAAVTFTSSSGSSTWQASGTNPSTITLLEIGV